jgi:hypothetical protein
MTAWNGNEYQEYFQAGKGGLCIELITLTPSRADWQEILEPQLPGTVKACPGLYGVTLLLTLPGAKHCYIFRIQNISLRTPYSLSSTVIPPFVVTECNTHNSNKILKPGKEQYLEVINILTLSIIMFVFAVFSMQYAVSPAGRHRTWPMAASINHWAASCASCVNSKWCAAMREWWSASWWANSWVNGEGSEYGSVMALIAVDRGSVPTRVNRLENV